MSYALCNEFFSFIHFIFRSCSRLCRASLGETTAVGRVSEKVVRLQRVTPMVGNSFKPFFIGHFEVRGEETVLIGKFTMLPLVKVFIGFWFGTCGLFAGAVLLGGFKPQGPNATIFLLLPFLMICGGIALVTAGKWFARNDTAWLSELIATALGAQRDGASVTRDALINVDADTVPMSLKVAAILLAASGAMALAAGMVGPLSWPTLTQGALVACAAKTFLMELRCDYEKLRPIQRPDRLIV